MALWSSCVYFMEEECEEKLLALRVNNNIKLKFCKFVPPISENDYFCTVSGAIIHTILLGEAAMFYIVNLCSTSVVIVCTGENEGRKWQRTSSIGGKQSLSFGLFFTLSSQGFRYSVKVHGTNWLCVFFRVLDEGVTTQCCCCNKL